MTCLLGPALPNPHRRPTPRHATTPAPRRLTPSPTQLIPTCHRGPPPHRSPADFSRPAMPLPHPPDLPTRRFPIRTRSLRQPSSSLHSLASLRLSLPTRGSSCLPRPAPTRHHVAPQHTRTPSRRRTAHPIRTADDANSLLRSAARPVSRRLPATRRPDSARSSPTRPTSPLRIHHTPTGRHCPPLLRPPPPPTSQLHPRHLSSHRLANPPTRLRVSPLFTPDLSGPPGTPQADHASLAPAAPSPRPAESDQFNTNRTDHTTPANTAPARFDSPTQCAAIRRHSRQPEPTYQPQ